MINPALILGFVAMAHPPLDATYVFRVPVRIENMRHVTQAAVSCNVRIERTSGDLISVGSTGLTLAWMPLRDGSLTDTATVTVTIPTSLLGTGTPTHWSCSLIYDFRNPDGSIFRESTLEGERERAYTRITGQEITTAVVIVEGALPRP
jgi:hypothetical protein